MTRRKSDALAVLQGRDVLVTKPTGSEKIIDLPNDFLGTRVHESSFFEKKLDGDEICTSDNATDFSRERSVTSFGRENVDAIFLFAEDSMGLFKKLEDKTC